jgi:hypothetical protein
VGVLLPGIDEQGTGRVIGRADRVIVAIPKNVAGDEDESVLSGVDGVDGVFSKEFLKATGVWAPVAITRYNFHNTPDTPDTPDTSDKCLSINGLSSRLPRKYSRHNPDRM